jgi:hypothetical protein
MIFINMNKGEYRMKSFKDFVVEETKGPEVHSVVNKDMRDKEPEQEKGVYYHVERVGPVASKYKVYHHYGNYSTANPKNASITATHYGDDTGNTRAFNSQIKDTEEHKALTKDGLRHISSVIVPYPDSPPKGFMGKSYAIRK